MEVIIPSLKYVLIDLLPPIIPNVLLETNAKRITTVTLKKC